MHGKTTVHLSNNCSVAKVPSVVLSESHLFGIMEKKVMTAWIQVVKFIPGWFLYYCDDVLQSKSWCGDSERVRSSVLEHTGLCYRIRTLCIDGNLVSFQVACLFFSQGLLIALSVINTHCFGKITSLLLLQYFLLFFFFFLLLASGLMCTSFQIQTKCCP